MKMKIRKGDMVEVITGREQDKGKRGEVIKVLPKERRIVVQGANLRKKHQRQVQTEGRTLQPGIIEFEAKMNISNVMLVCPNCSETTRVAVEREEDGTFHRVCKQCEKQID
jgi:large subunit ribosomal protein L24